MRRPGAYRCAGRDATAAAAGGAGDVAAPAPVSFLASVALPGLLGQLLLAADRDVVVAIGQLRHHRAAGAGLGLRHQPLQLGRAGCEVLALGLELLAFVEIVFGGIGERQARAVADAGATGQPAPSASSAAAASARKWLAMGRRRASDLRRQTMLRLPKAAAGVGIEALPWRPRSLMEGQRFGPEIIPIPLRR